MRFLSKCVAASLLLSSLGSACAQTVDKPLGIGDGVVAPKLTHQVDPKFPRPIFAKPKGGEVLVHLVVDADGLPQKVMVQQSTNPKLNDAALKAVRQYRFEPATKDGKPVAVELKVAVNFQLF